MKYLYSLPNCPKCDKLKKEYDKQGIEYIERDGNRLTTPSDDRDDIDVDAFVQLSMANMRFPVEVNIDE